MAGHRRGSGQLTREANRIAEHKRRVHTAPTGRRQAAAAFDRLRSAASRHPDAEALWHEIATDLNSRAIALESGVAA
jgi:hypothetical protein